MGSATIWGLRFEWISVEAKSCIHNSVSSSSSGRRISQFRRRNEMLICCNASRRHLWLKPELLLENATAISAREHREQHYYVTHSCFAKIHQLIRSPLPFLTNSTPSKFWILLCVAIVVLVTAVRAFVVRKSRYKRPGSVADLVKRGQLRYDSRGMYDFGLSILEHLSHCSKSLYVSTSRCLPVNTKIMEQTRKRLMIDPTKGQDFERPLKSHVKSNAQSEKTSINNQVSDPDKFENPSASEEKPGL